VYEKQVLSTGIAAIIQRVILRCHRAVLSPHTSVTARCWHFRYSTPALIRHTEHVGINSIYRLSVVQIVVQQTNKSTTSRRGGVWGLLLRKT